MVLGVPIIGCMELHISDDTLPVMDDTVNDESSNPTAFGELECQVCGKALIYAGRGRKPRFCEDHKPKGAKSSGSTNRSKGVPIDTLVNNIEQFYMTVGMGLSFLPATQPDSMTVVSSASQLAESWRPAIEANPKIRKFWEKMFTAGSYGTVITAHLIVAIPIMQRHNIIPSIGGGTTEHE